MADAPTLAPGERDVYKIVSVVRQLSSKIAAVPGSGLGDVVGPASATDNAVARFDGTTGKLIQNSGVIIDDSNNVTVPGVLTLDTSILLRATTDRIAASWGTQNVLQLSGQGNSKTTAFHLNPGSGTLAADTVSEFVLQRTADQAFGGNYGRVSLTALGTSFSGIDALHAEYGGTVAPLRFDFSIGIENPPSTFASYTFMSLMYASGGSEASQLGAVTFGNDTQTSQRNIISLVRANIGSAGTRDSNAIIWEGKANDGTERAAWWRQYVDVTSNAGASSFLLQSNLNGAGWNTRASLTDIGALSVASLALTTGPITLSSGGTDRLALSWGTENVLQISGQGNSKTAAIHINPGSGTLPTGTIAEFVLQRTADQAFGGNYGRWSFTALGSANSDISGFYGEYGGSVTPGPFIFNLGVENPASTFTSYEYIRLQTTGSAEAATVGAVSFGASTTVPFNQVVLNMASIGSAGTRDSNAILWEGKANDGTERGVWWRQKVDVTSNAGASSFVWERNLNGAGWTGVMSLTSGDALVLPGGQIKFPATQVSSSDANTLDDYEEGTWTPAWGGFSADPTGGVAKFVKVGRLVKASLNAWAAGTSNATTKTISLPFASESADVMAGMGHAFDNGAFSNNPCRIDTRGASVTADVYRDLNVTAWTASGSCVFDFTIVYTANA